MKSYIKYFPIIVKGSNFSGLVPHMICVFSSLKKLGFIVNVASNSDSAGCQIEIIDPNNTDNTVKFNVLSPREDFYDKFVIEEQKTNIRELLVWMTDHLNIFFSGQELSVFLYSSHREITLEFHPYGTIQF